MCSHEYDSNKWQSLIYKRRAIIYSRLVGCRRFFCWCRRWEKELKLLQRWYSLGYFNRLCLGGILRQIILIKTTEWRKHLNFTLKINCWPFLNNNVVLHFTSKCNTKRSRDCLKLCTMSESAAVCNSHTHSCYRTLHTLVYFGPLRYMHHISWKSSFMFSLCLRKSPHPANPVGNLDGNVRGRRTAENLISDTSSGDRKWAG